MKRVLSLLCALALLCGMIPVAAFADDTTYSCEWEVVVKEGTPDGIISPGEEVAVELHLKNASWCSGAAGTALQKFNVSVSYDSSVFSAKKMNSKETDAAKNQTLLYASYEDAVQFKTAVAADAGSLGAAYVLGDDYNADYTLTDDEIINTWYLIANDPLPANEDIEESFEFSYDELTFGNRKDSSENIDDVIKEVSVTANAEIPTLRVDTKGPDVTLDGGTETTFFYQPVTVAATDSSDVASITLNGEAIENGANITAGGTIVATDTLGNATTVTVTIDSTLYDAAVTAADLIGDTVTYADKDLVEAAQAALDKVTDEAAKAKLADVQAKVAAAVSTIQAIVADKTAVEEKIAALGSEPTATQINEIKQAIAELEKKGVSTTDITGYDTYKAAADKMQAQLDAIDKVEKQIAALPVGDALTYEDKDDVVAAREAVTQLAADYKGAEPSNIAKLTAAEQTIEGIESDIKTVDDEIGAWKDKTVHMADIEGENGINALETKVKALVEGKKVPETMFTNWALYEKLITRRDTLLAGKEATQDKIDALPDAEKVTFADEPNVTAIRNEVESWIDSGDYTAADFDTTKLKAAEDQLETLHKNRNALVDTIKNLKADDYNLSNEGEITELRAQVEDMKEKLSATFTEAELENLVACEKKLTDLHNQVTAAKNDIAALGDIVKVADYDKVITTLPATIKALQDQGAQFTDAELAKLAKAQQTIANQKKELSDYTEELEKNLPATVTYADIAKKDELDATAAKLESYGYTLTGDKDLTETAYSKRTAYNTAVTNLKNDIAAAKASIAALGDVKFKDHAKIAALAETVAALQKLDVPFTADELAKLAAAQSTVAAQKQALSDYTAALEKLPAAATYASIAKKDELDAAAAKLESYGYTLDKVTLGNTAYEKREAFNAAVAKMEAAIAAVNKKADEAVAGWKYGDDSALKAIAAEMAALQKEYEISADAMATVFHNYAFLSDPNGTLEKLAAHAQADILKLPASITLADEAAVAHITSDLAELTKYMTQDQMIALVGKKNYDTYLAAVKKIEELKTASNDSDDSSSAAQSADSSSAAAEDKSVTLYYTCPACGYHNWTGTEGGYKCDHCGHIVTKELTGYGNVKGTAQPTAAAAKAVKIPQTSDTMPIEGIAGLAIVSGLALAGLALLRKRRMDR